jgi:murein DD-endopeptidase MepM/ murein hydrolase activator NlpD
VARSGTGAGPWLTGRAATVAVAALLTTFCGAASAATGGAPTPGSSPAAPSPSGSPAAAEPSAGALTLTSATTTPRKSFYYGFRYPRLSFSIESDQPQNDLRIDVVNREGWVVQTFYRNDVAPQAVSRIRWDGTTSEGRPAPNGRYHFQIGPQTTGPLARPSDSSEPPALGFSFYRFAFPVLGPHGFGTAMDRFGAPRSGHTHQGQDILASCGLPIVAARGGTVQYSGYEANAGNYVVIDGRGTPLDFMYAHLASPSPLHTGEPVRTGQPIGVVGQTGDAVGCHLHFEIWTGPGWYQGGSPIDPLPMLKQWDRYS